MKRGVSDEALNRVLDASYGRAANAYGPCSEGHIQCQLDDIAARAAVVQSDGPGPSDPPATLGTSIGRPMRWGLAAAMLSMVLVMLAILVMLTVAAVSGLIVGGPHGAAGKEAVFLTGNFGAFAGAVIGFYASHRGHRKAQELAQCRREARPAATDAPRPRRDPSRT